MSASTASSSPDMADHHHQKSSSTGGGSVFKFHPGQKVYCYHGIMMYDARCVKTEIKDGKPKYFIHYHGWNKNWDEWVEENRILECNAENKQKYDELRIQPSARSGGGKRSMTNKLANSSLSSTTSTPSTTNTPNLSNRSDGNVTRKSSISTPTNASIGASGDVTSGVVGGEEKSIRKRRRRTPRQNYATDKTYIKFHQDEPKIPIPDSLKHLLVEDYFQIQKEQKIINLLSSLSSPSTTQKTINDLFNDYVEDRCKKEDENKSTIIDQFPNEPQLRFTNDPINLNLKYDNLGPNFRKSCYRELVQGLRNYFNSILAPQLLYNLERLQYYEIFGVDATNQENSQQNINSSTGDNQNLNVQDLNQSELQTSKIRCRKNSDTINSHAVTSTPTTNISSKLKASNQQPTQNAREPSDIYLPIHLLRLFTKLGCYLQYFNGDKGLFRVLDMLFGDFLNFLAENQDRYFGANNLQYIEVNREYVQRMSLNISISNNNNNNFIGSEQSMLSISVMDTDDNLGANGGGAGSGKTK